MHQTSPTLALCALIIGLFILTGNASASQTDIAGPAGSGTFGNTVTVLPNGNIVVVDTGYDLSGPTVLNVGAVHLYNGTTLALISTITGSTASDSVGNGLITVLTNGNYVVNSPSWDNPSPSTLNAGAVTWCSATTGCSGVVSAANSLIGGTLSDGVGNLGVTALTNGNYVVRSRDWDNPSPLTADVGAVTWGNGASGTVGLVSATNSLIGGTASDQVGDDGITALTNGNYVVSSINWDNPSPSRINAGAVTWGNGASGTVGLVSASNSLVGGTASDNIGNSGVIALTNGNYVVSSRNWDNSSPAALNAGAVTWGNGTGGTVGVVTSSNSLVGGTALDGVGNSGVTGLTNGNYVVRSSSWDNPSPLIAGVGAVTWGNGAGGTIGLVSVSNSLIGGTAGDSIGSTQVTPLTNGNYVVSSPAWDNPSPVITDVGAVTWGNGTGGTIGLVTSSNSLIGGTAFDTIGSNGVTALTNGNYVARNNIWSNPSPSTANVGAMTWGNGAGGTVGLVTSSNSLIGGTAADQVGSGGITPLPNGNYIAYSLVWDNPSPAAVDARAVTFGNGVSGTSGLLTSANSVVGTAANGANTFSYDATRNRVFVGRSASNIVSVLFFNTTAIVDGNSNNPATWNTGLPNALVNGIIPNGRTVTLNAIMNAGQIAVECGGALTGGSASAYVIGSIRKEYCAAAGETFLYPLGDADEYSPMQTANVNGTGRLTASVTDSLLIGLLATHSASRFWSLNGSGITTNLSFTYTDGDVSGTETAYNVYRRFSTTTTQATPSSINAATNTATVTGVSSFSDWGVGNLFAPLAANVSVSGRVSTANGNGLRNAIVNLTDSNGNSRSVRTGSFGYYSFDDVEVGATYTVNVAAKRFTFAIPTQVITVKDSIADVDFTAE